MRLRWLAGFFLILAFGGDAAAQTLEDRIRDQLRQTMEQLHQAQNDQAVLKAKLTAAETERDSLKQQVALLRAQQRPQAVRASVPSQALQTQIAREREALAQAGSTVQEAQADHARLQTIVTNQANMLATCQQKNVHLLKVSYDILDKFEHVDWYDDLNLAEPFVQDTRVNLEKVAQDYGDQIYDGKFDPRAVKLTSPSATTRTETKPAQQAGP